MKKFDVAIAGGGVIGGAIALELARAGLRVAVFDRQQPGQEASWASAGILSPAPENRGMVAMVPLGKASIALYPEFVARVEEISGRSTGFRPKGTLEALFSHDTKAELSTIIALHHGLGLKAEPLRAIGSAERKNGSEMDDYCRRLFFGGDRWNCAVCAGASRKRTDGRTARRRFEDRPRAVVREDLSG